MALNSAQSIFNLIRIRASKEYQDIVPALSDKSPIGDVSTPILTNPMIFKEFSILLGAFLEYEVDKRVWNNPLAELIRSNGRPLGEYSAEIANNPVTPRPYNPNEPEKVLEYAMLDDKVAYYVRNVKELFKVSIAREDMMGAFASYDKFNDYVSMKLSSLESGRQLSMFNHVFESIVANYNAGALVVSDVHTGSGNYANWTVEAKNVIDGFAYPSTLYNKYGQLAGSNGDFKGWTNTDDIYIMATANWINSADVNFLATLFNIDRADLRRRIIKVIDFGYDAYKDDGNGNTVFDKHVTTDIDAIIFDRRMLHFTNDLEIDDTFYNPETLVTNYYKHWWATYQLSPFANCVVFTRSDAPEEFELSANSVAIDSSQASETATVTYTPTDAEVTFEFVSGYGRNGSLDETAIEALISIGANAGTITVTMLDAGEFVALYKVNGQELLINGMQTPSYDDIVITSKTLAMSGATASTTYTPTDAEVVISFIGGYSPTDATFISYPIQGFTYSAENGTITFTLDETTFQYSDFIMFFDINGQTVKVSNV